MKYLLIALLSIVSVGQAFSQDCERIVENCEKLLTKKTNGSEFISDGQVYTAFLDRNQEAVFQTTFFGGSTYRIAASAGDDENYVIFTIKDPQGQILFSNKNYKIVMIGLSLMLVYFGITFLTDMELTTI